MSATAQPNRRQFKSVPSHKLEVLELVASVDGTPVGTVHHCMREGGWDAWDRDGVRVGSYRSDREACRALGEHAGLIGPYDRVK